LNGFPQLLQVGSFEETLTAANGLGMARRATKKPATRASGTLSRIISLTARKWDPVVSRSSTTAMFLDMPEASLVVEAIVRLEFVRGKPVSLMDGIGGHDLLDYFPNIHALRRVQPSADLDHPVVVE